MYLKFAENVDMLVEIMNAKFKNGGGRTMGTLDANNLKKKISVWCCLI